MSEGGGFIFHIDDLLNSSNGIFSDKTETTIAVDPNERPKLEGIPIPEQDKDSGKLINPIPDPDDSLPTHTGHGGGLDNIDIPNNTGGNQILEHDWRDFILTNQDKSFVDYKSNLNKGDQIDLSKFTDRQKVSGGKANYIDPKTGWILSPDRAGINSHGGSSWKLLDKKGNRIATLDKNGNVLRK